MHTPTQTCAYLHKRMTSQRVLKVVIGQMSHALPWSHCLSGLMVPAWSHCMVTLHGHCMVTLHESLNKCTCLHKCNWRVEWSLHGPCMAYHCAVAHTCQSPKLTHRVVQHYSKLVLTAGKDFAFHAVYGNFDRDFKGWLLHTLQMHVFHATKIWREVFMRDVCLVQWGGLYSRPGLHECC